MQIMNQRSLGIRVTGNVIISNSKFVLNTATVAGGGVFSNGVSATVIISGCRFENNTSAKGGGMYSSLRMYQISFQT